MHKTKARNAAKMIRSDLAQRYPDAGVEMLRHWLDVETAATHRLGRTPKTVSVFLSIQSEIDTMPLMRGLEDAGFTLALPCIKRAAHPLEFRAYGLGDKLRGGVFNTREPLRSADIVRPDIVLAPLLAFSRIGYRLGYGGGFYDRTLAKLRASDARGGEVFACGIAFSGQEVPTLPTDQYDEKLDGVLRETGYKDFTCA